MQRFLTRAWRLLAYLLLLSGCSPSPEPSADGPPSRVVVVSIDTLRADYVGCYGAVRAKTPTLDAIAAQGARFDAAISPVPLTLPSHSTLLTGLNPPHHGVRGNVLFRLADDVPTLAERFSEAGFATAAFVGAVVLDRRYGLARGFDHYGDHMGVRSSARLGPRFPERRADAVVDEALAWLDDAPARFFLWLHLYDPHAEYTPPRRYREMFPGTPYAGEVAFSDAETGRLLSAIDERWSDGRTLVVVTSDHGESLGEHDEDAHGYFVYDATQRIPLLMWGPGIPAGNVVSSVVSLADVAPTLLARAGLPPLPAASGRDLSGLLAGEAAPEADAWVETLGPQLLFGWSPLLGVRTVRWKYVRAPEPELYDLGADPGEQRNLAAARRDVAGVLDRRIDERLAGAREARTCEGLSPEERAKLESLGYLVGPAAVEDAALGQVGGPDPKAKTRELRLYLEGLSLLQQGRADEALARLDRVPEERGFLFSSLRAEAALNQGDYARTERNALRMIELGKGLDSAYSLLARALWKQGRVEAARVAIEKSVEFNPGSANSLIALAQIQQRLGNDEGAEASYRRAVESREGSPEAVVRLAAFLLNLDRAEEADAVLATLPPDVELDSEPVMVLAVAEAEAGRVEIAVRRLQEAMRANPTSPKLALAYASVLESAHDPEAALVAYEKALALNPDDPGAQNNVAWNLALLDRDIDRALALSERATAAMDDHPDFADTLATIHLRRGEYESALAAAERGFDGADEAQRARLLYDRARAFAALGRTSSARGDLAASLELIDPSAPPAWTADAGALAGEIGVDVPSALRRVL